MKRVLVVDDEKLVRKGIISTFPWASHGFVVAGEAGGGESALEFLSGREIDLVITDLAMPGMSGFELIKEVKARYPGIDIVILTCHDNFKYIQDAMRLGVLDYIVKTEIEDDIIEDTLNRISQKMNKKDDTLLSGSVMTQKGELIASGLLICGTKTQSDLMQLLKLGSRLITGHTLLEVDRLTWFVPMEECFVNQVSSLFDNQSWALSFITDINGCMDQVMVSRLKAYRWGELFYSCEPSKLLYRYSMNRTCPAGTEISSITDNGTILAKWNELLWIYSEDSFERLLQDTRIAHIERKKILSSFHTIALEWDKLLSMGNLQSLLESFEDFLFWYHWEEWLRQFRAQILSKVNQNSNENITASIMKALEYIKSAMYMELVEEEIARKVNMSRSYFSQCFKRVTGKTFGDYCRDLKIEKAKSLILGGDEPLALIAEKCGFLDYRYFSRIFREMTGMLPNEYRRLSGIRHL